MAGGLSIWSPVIIAQLKNPQTVKEQVSYTVDKIFKSMEELKVKVKYTEIKIQGQTVEAQIKLDILCLLRDITGTMELITREETVREKIPLMSFNNPIGSEKQTSFVIDILNLYWEGEIRDYEICVAYFLDYMIIAIREQAVRITEEKQQDLESNSLREVLHQLEREVARVEKENYDLRRRLFLYERDISSLKKGIRKAENRSAVLNRELSYYQKAFEELQASSEEKQDRIQLHNRSPYKRSYPKDSSESPEKSRENDSPLNLGKRIKQMFAND